MPCYATAILSLRAEYSENRLCDVAVLRLRAVFLRLRSRVGLAALATGLSRTASSRQARDSFEPPQRKKTAAESAASSTP